MTASNDTNTKDNTRVDNTKELEDLKWAGSKIKPFNAEEKQQQKTAGIKADDRTTQEWTGKAGNKETKQDREPNKSTKQNVPFHQKPLGDIPKQSEEKPHNKDNKPIQGEGKPSLPPWRGGEGQIRAPEIQNNPPWRGGQPRGQGAEAPQHPGTNTPTNQANTNDIKPRDNQPPSEAMPPKREQLNRPPGGAGSPRETYADTKPPSGERYGSVNTRRGPDMSGERRQQPQRDQSPANIDRPRNTNTQVSDNQRSNQWNKEGNQRGGEFNKPQEDTGPARNGDKRPAVQSALYQKPVIQAIEHYKQFKDYPNGEPKS